MSKDTEQLKMLDGNVAEINMTIPKEEAKQTYDKVVANYAQRVKIPGFRPGKAPKGIVEKHVGIEQIQHSVIDQLFPKYFSEITSKNKLSLATQPYIESYDFGADKDLTLVVKAELKPELTLGEYKNMDLKYEEFKNPQDALDKEMDFLKEQGATNKNVKDRKTKEDDLVVFDFEGFTGDKPIVGGKGEKYTLDLAHSNFIPGFAEGLVGHEIGEEFSINVKFPEDYHSEELKGADAEFKIKIHEIKEKVYPELNDEYASKISNKRFTTMEALKTDIQKHLNEMEANSNTRIKEAVVLDKVLEGVKVDIQQTMITREAEAVRSEAVQNAAHKGLKWEDIVKESGLETLNKQFEEEAYKRVKNSLTIEKIAEVENIQVNQQDILMHINDVARMYGAQMQDLITEIRKQPEYLSTITQQVVSKKVMQFLLDNNKFTPKAAKKGDK